MTTRKTLYVENFQLSEKHCHKIHFFVDKKIWHLRKRILDFKENLEILIYVYFEVINTRILFKMVGGRYSVLKMHQIAMPGIRMI